MMLRHAVIAAVFLLLAGGFASARDPAAAVLEMSADGEVQIAVDGKVSDYRLRSTLAPAVADLVDRNVRGWTFEPVVVDGVPVIAKTAVHLDLKAEPTELKDKYKLRIVNVTFGAPRRASNDHMRPPHYPEAAVGAHLGAKVWLYLLLDDTGKVVQAQARQTSLDKQANSELEAERWRKLFEKSSIAAAKEWHFDLSEAINGKTIGMTAVVPIVYSVRDMPARAPENEWKSYAPGPVHPAPWLSTAGGADNSALSTLQDGQALSLESRFRLKDDVVGKAL